MDTNIFWLLNNMAGHSALLDAAIIFCASYLQYILVIVIFFIILVRTQSWRAPLTALVAAGIARGVIKTIILSFYARPRPFVVLNGVHQLISSKGEEYQSFPSGHALFFFAFAAAAYAYDRRLGRWLYASAVLMGIARVAAGVHWPSDIIAGAIFGILSAAIALRLIPALSPADPRT